MVDIILAILVEIILIDLDSWIQHLCEKEEVKREITKDL